MRRIAFLVVLIAVLLFANISLGEGNILYVCVSNSLNGRIEPNKQSDVMMQLYPGDTVEPTGNIQNGWIEIKGGENGTAWVKSEYVSEIFEPIKYVNVSKGRVWVRSEPIDGRKINKIKVKQEIMISQIVSGWGYVEDLNGWVDLNFFEKKND